MELELDDLDDKSRRRKIRSRESRRMRQRELEDDIREARKEKEQEEMRKREIIARKEAEERRIEEERKLREDRSWSKYQQYNKTLSDNSPKIGLEINRETPITVSLPKAKKIETNPKDLGFSDEPEQNPLLMIPSKKKLAMDPSLSFKKDINQVIHTIPSKKEELFGCTVDWEIVKQNDIIEKAMKPWLKKMTVEFLGEEESSFVTFICKKLGEEKPAEEMVTLMEPLLEDDAEDFVIRMWRILICHIKMEIND